MLETKRQGRVAVCCIGVMCMATCLCAQERQKYVSETDSTLTFRQSDAKEVILEKRPKRVIVVLPSLLAAWNMAGGTVVGSSDTSGLPPGALAEEWRGLPSIGRSVSPNVEAIMELRPDLVVLSDKTVSHAAVANILTNAGIAVVRVAYDNYDDLPEVLELFCRVNGGKMEESSAIQQFFRSVEDVKKSALEERAKRKSAVRFVCLFTSGMGFTAEGNAVHTPTIAVHLGGENAIGNMPGLRQRYNLERLAIEDPDVIFINAMGNAAEIERRFKERWEAEPVWRSLSAVKAGRVHFLPQKWFLYLPGGEFPEAFAYMKTLLYPSEQIAK